jgi:enoyl-CoA hydratase/carnithine racemase
MMPSPLEATRFEVADGIAVITLHRPERLNAWTAIMNAEYRSLLQTADDDPAVRVIVVTGSGRGFCAGAESDDLAGHAARGAYDAGAPDDLATPGYGVREEFDAELAYHFGVSKPILAAINGPVAGIGFALSCYCDLRFAARGAKFTTAHGRLGLPCAFGLAWLLPKLIGLPRALDLILSSRTFDADEAHTLGLVTAVVDGPELLDHVLTFARMLATTVSPASLAASKRQVYEAFHLTAAQSVRAAEAMLDPMMAGPDYREGVAALREKRPPVFGDPPPRS